MFVSIKPINGVPMCCQGHCYWINRGYHRAWGRKRIHPEFSIVRGQKNTAANKQISTWLETPRQNMSQEEQPTVGFPEHWPSGLYPSSGLGGWPPQTASAGTCALWFLVTANEIQKRRMKTSSSSNLLSSCKRGGCTIELVHISPLILSDPPCSPLYQWGPKIVLCSFGTRDHPGILPIPLKIEVASGFLKMLNIANLKMLFPDRA